MNQAECLRRYGYEEEARLVESGQLKLPPDALKMSMACLEIADALRELAAGFDEKRERCSCGSERFHLVRNTRTQQQAVKCASCKKARTEAGIPQGTPPPAS
jgi:hypothetical protein